MYMYVGSVLLSASDVTTSERCINMFVTIIIIIIIILKSTSTKPQAGKLG